MNPPESPNNPYAAYVPQASLDPNVFQTSGGLVNQVMVVGILQIVLGAMELLMSLLLGFYSVVIAIIPNDEMSDVPPEFKILLSVGLGIVAAVVLTFAVLRIMSGVYSFGFRQRTMMIVSLIGGLVTIFTCYCSLFSIGVGIYGMIVMLDPAVKQAYAMAANGMPVEEIKARFARARYGL